MRVSQMGAQNSDLNFGAPLFKKIQSTVAQEGGAQRNDSNSPTPQRNANKNLASGGVKKVQTQKSVNGAINKMQRDSMGESANQQQELLNFYEMQAKERENNGSHLIMAQNQ